MASRGWTLVYLDTHVVIWLYQKERTLFTLKGQGLIDTENLLISPIVELEIEYLFEIDKISERSSKILQYLQNKIDLKISTFPFGEVIKKAVTVKWTRDPFDRIITAQAAVDDAILLSRDKQIQKHYPKAVW